MGAWPPAFQQVALDPRGTYPGPSQTALLSCSWRGVCKGQEFWPGKVRHLPPLPKAFGTLIPSHPPCLMPSQVGLAARGPLSSCTDAAASSSSWDLPSVRWGWDTRPAEHQQNQPATHGCLPRKGRSSPAWDHAGHLHCKPKMELSPFSQMPMEFRQLGLPA